MTNPTLDYQPNSIKLIQTERYAPEKDLAAIYCDLLQHTNVEDSDIEVVFSETETSSGRTRKIASLVNQRSNEKSDEYSHKFTIEEDAVAYIGLRRLFSFSELENWGFPTLETPLTSLTADELDSLLHNLQFLSENPKYIPARARYRQEQVPTTPKYLSQFLERHGDVERFRQFIEFYENTDTNFLDLDKTPDPSQNTQIQTIVKDESTAVIRAYIAGILHELEFDYTNSSPAVIPITEMLLRPNYYPGNRGLELEEIADRINRDLERIIGFIHNPLSGIRISEDKPLTDLDHHLLAFQKKTRLHELWRKENHTPILEYYDMLRRLPQTLDYEYIESIENLALNSPDELTLTELFILNMHKGSPEITIEMLASSLGITRQAVESRIKSALKHLQNPSRTNKTNEMILGKQETAALTQEERRLLEKDDYSRMILQQLSRRIPFVQDYLDSKDGQIMLLNSSVEFESWESILNLIILKQIEIDEGTKPEIAFSKIAILCYCISKLEDPEYHLLTDEQRKTLGQTILGTQASATIGTTYDPSGRSIYHIHTDSTHFDPYSMQALSIAAQNPDPVQRNLEHKRHLKALVKEILRGYPDNK